MSRFKITQIRNLDKQRGYFARKKKFIEMNDNMWLIVQIEKGVF